MRKEYPVSFSFAALVDIVAGDLVEVRWRVVAMLGMLGGVVMTLLAVVVAM